MAAERGQEVELFLRRHLLRPRLDRCERRVDLILCGFGVEVDFREAIDIRRLPIVKHYEMDLSPVITMGAAMKDPDTGFYDVSFIKGFPKAPDRLGISIHSPHFDRIYDHYEKRAQIKRELEGLAPTQQAGERVLAGVRANYDGAPAEGATWPEAGRFDGRVLLGDPGEQLSRFAVEEGFDLIVVGNRGMTGIRRFLGSVPKDVARGAEMSVLIAKTT